MNKIEKDLVVIEKKSFKHNTRALLRKKKLVQVLRTFSGIKISESISSFSGTIIFDTEVSLKDV